MNRVRVAAEDAEGRMKLAGHMVRAPLSLAKMNYDAAPGRVFVFLKRVYTGNRGDTLHIPGGNRTVVPGRVREARG